MCAILDSAHKPFFDRDVIDARKGAIQSYITLKSCGGRDYRIEDLNL